MMSTEPYSSYASSSTPSPLGIDLTPTPSPSPPVRKPKAQRVPRIKPCTSCQARKVACTGLELPGALACASCELHGLVCSKSPVPLSGPIQPAKRPKQQHLKELKTRVGSRLALLQSEQAAQRFEVALVNLSPRSTSARLKDIELGSALTWSLVNCAFEETSVTGLAPITSLTVVQEDFRHKGRTTGLNLEQEILLGCYMAIGSRRSSHSAVVGILDSGLSWKSLGKRRETACRTLVHRTVELIQDSSILSSPSVESLEIVTAVKEMIQTVYPDHPFLLETGPILHKLRLGVLAQGHQFSLMDDVRMGFILSDARARARAGIRPFFSDATLAGYDMMGPDSLPQTLLKMSQPEKFHPASDYLTGNILVCQLAVLRRVHGLEEQALHRPKMAHEAFAFLWDVVDVATAFVKHKLAHPVVGGGAASRSDFIGQVPDLLLAECHLTAAARKVAQLGGQWEEVMERARVRFLMALKWAGETLSSSGFTRSADVHWLARRLLALELVPNFVIWAAEEARKRDGVLNWQDIQRLHKAFEAASSIFASTSMRADQLEAVLLEAGHPLATQEAADLVEAALLHVHLTP